MLSAWPYILLTNPKNNLHAETIASDLKRSILEAQQTDKRSPKWQTAIRKSQKSHKKTTLGIFPFHVKVFPRGFLPPLSANPVCKSQPIDAVVELGWD